MNLFNFEEYSTTLQNSIKKETQSMLKVTKEIEQRNSTIDQEISDEEFDEKPRLISSLGWDPAKSALPNVRPILEFIKCSICQDTAIDPKVIKHCLHFFCKECIEPYVLRQ